MILDVAFLSILLLFPGNGSIVSASANGLRAGRGDNDNRGDADETAAVAGITDATFLDPFTAGRFLGGTEESSSSPLPLPEELPNNGLSNSDDGEQEEDGTSSNARFNRDGSTSSHAVRLGAGNNDDDDSDADSFEKRIIGGQVASREQRHFCMILDKGNDGGWYQGKCGATLIADKWVLTAAHCCHNTRRNDIAHYVDGCYMNAFAPSQTVRRNGQTLYNAGHEYQAIPFKGGNCNSCHPHPQHVPGVATSYDVMVCELAHEAHPSLTRMPVAGPGYFDSLPSGTNLKVSGFGRTSNQGQGTTRLKEASVPKVDRSQCARAMSPYAVTNTMVCAGGQGNDSCNGDSGSPLTHNNNVLCGPVSWGSSSCGTRGKPGVYTDLGNPQIHNWLKGFNMAGIKFVYGSGNRSSSTNNNNNSNNSCQDVTYTFRVWNPRRNRQERNKTCADVRSNGWCDYNSRWNNKGTRIGTLCKSSCPNYC